MDLLDLYVKIAAKDEASQTVDDVSQNIIGKLGKAATTAAKALAGMWAVKKVVEFGKAAFDSYAQLEQLEGGIKKLYGNAGMEIEDYAKSVNKSVEEVTEEYQRNAEAEKILFENAQQAWRTAGMTANDYMNTATQFSASLITSLGGDTKKAAEITDRAMTVISDNVNTFGSDADSVRNAILGIAKGNYTMLDNLKLGFAGTKEGAKELVKAANEWGAANGEASNLSVDSFADMIVAIEQVQKAQGIYGTTSKEALSTIEGSMNATKAAWQNLVTEFGKPDANIGARIADMFTAIMGKNGEGGLARNVLNEVKVIAGNMASAFGGAIEQGLSFAFDNAPSIVSQGMQKLGEALSSAASAVSGFTSSFDLTEFLFGSGDDAGAIEKVRAKAADFIERMGSAISESWPVLQEGFGQLVGNLGEAFQKYGPQVASAVGRLVADMGKWVVEHAPEFAAKLGELIGNGIATIGKFAADMSAKGHEIMAGLIFGTSEEGKALHKWFANFFPDGLLKGLGDFGKFLLDTGKALIDGLIGGIEEVAPDVAEAIRAAFDTVLEFFSGVGEFLKDPVGSIKNGLDNLMGAFDDTDKSVEKSTDDARDNIGKLNSTKLESKKATATVDGNAQDGKAKKAVEETSGAVQAMQGNTVTAKADGNATDGKAKKAVDDTTTAVKNLSGKTVTVKAEGNAVDGSAKTWVDRLKDSIRGLSDKTVNVRTNQTTVVTKLERAEGGIRKHAMGDIMVANRRGLGVPLDIVGEAGPEAIVPLTSRYGREFAEMMGKEAANVMSGMADGNRKVVNVYLTYNANEDATELVRDIADELSLVL